MEQKKVKPYSKEQTKDFAVKVLEKRLGGKVIKIKYVGGGSFGYVYKAEMSGFPNKIIVKACRVSGMHLCEAKALEMLGKTATLHIPKVYFTFEADDEFDMDFIVEEYINGTNCFTDFTKLFKGKAKKQAFASCVADCLYNWHCVKNNKFGSLENPEYENWLDYYKPFAEDILNTAVKMHKQGKITNKTLKVMEKAWENFDYIFSEPIDSASLIHGDLNVMNIMSDKQLNITGIIDPLESKWADREFDLFQLRNLTGEKFKLYETYKSKYPVSEKCDLKCAFYALYHEIYCYISSGSHTELILQAAQHRLVKEMNKSGIL